MEDTRLWFLFKKTFPSKRFESIVFSQIYRILKIRCNSGKLIYHTTAHFCCVLEVELSVGDVLLPSVVLRGEPVDDEHGGAGEVANGVGHGVVEKGWRKKKWAFFTFETIGNGFFN